jgi:4-hydroxy-2-oxoheptanedioate aldolase
VQIGLFVGLDGWIASEIMTSIGFDWIMLDTEHAPLGLDTVAAYARSAELSGCPLVVRPSSTEHIQRILDLGVRTIMAPRVESSSQARTLVEAVRYPPRGNRGVGPSLARAARWGADTDYLATADEEVCLWCQVESTQGVAVAAEIAAVEGVDSVFVGPSDLAASMGLAGQASHPDVRRAVTEVFDAVRSQGKPVGVYAATPALVDEYCGLGAQFVAVAVDTLALRAQLTEVLRTTRQRTNDQ